MFQISENAGRQGRISLDIDAGAPIILVPHSSKSRDVMVAILGTLTVSNKFLFSGSPGTKGHERAQKEQAEAQAARGQVACSASARGQVAYSASARGQEACSASARGQEAYSASARGQVACSASARGQVACSASARGQVACSASARGQEAYSASARGQVACSASARGQVACSASARGQEACSAGNTLSVCPQTYDRYSVLYTQDSHSTLRISLRIQVAGCGVLSVSAE